MVVAVVNAASLERNLYLVAELLPLPTPVVVGLNMMDVAADEGMSIEPQVLEAALGVPVVPMIAAKNQGLRELVEAVDRLARGEIRLPAQRARDPRRPPRGAGRDPRPDRRLRARSPIPATGWPSSCWRATTRSRP